MNNTQVSEQYTHESKVTSATSPFLRNLSGGRNMTPVRVLVIIGERVGEVCTGAALGDGLGFISRFTGLGLRCHQFL